MAAVKATTEAPRRGRQSRARSFLAAAPLAVGGGYLVWHAGWTLNADALWLALPLLVAECHAYLVYALTFLMTWDVTPHQAHVVRGGQRVDLFIATYDEPAWVLAPTVTGAVAVRYPHRTYVLDDGKRPWVQELARRIGAEYITREDRRGAKAGNINHALERTTGEFIGVLDADFVPTPDFIDAMLGYFEDPQVALVQGPQEFYNPDSFQHRGADDAEWHDQALFYRVLQPGKNRWNPAFWCGTPSLVRRRALESIGGVVADTITEDLHTSLRLHQTGWRTVFHAGTVARGVAPETYQAFIIQRVRWAKGVMQVIRREWYRRGLSPLQRLSYVACTTTYFDAHRKLILLLTIPAILITDQLPIRGEALVFLSVWARAGRGNGHWHQGYGARQLPHLAHRGVWPDEAIRLHQGERHADTRPQFCVSGDAERIGDGERAGGVHGADRCARRTVPRLLGALGRRASLGGDSERQTAPRRGRHLSGQRGSDRTRVCQLADLATPDQAACFPACRATARRIALGRFGDMGHGHGPDNAGRRRRSRGAA